MSREIGEDRRRQRPSQKLNVNCVYIAAIMDPDEVKVVGKNEFQTLKHQNVDHQDVYEINVLLFFSLFGKKFAAKKRRW